MRHLWKDKAITMTLPPKVSEADYLLSVMLFSNAPHLIEPYLFYLSKPRQINATDDWKRDHYWTEVASEAPAFEAMKEMESKSYKRGLVAGWVLCVLYIMVIKGVKEPSKRKARELLSENYLTKKWGDGSFMKCSRTLIETVEKAGFLVSKTFAMPLKLKLLDKYITQYCVYGVFHKKREVKE